MGIPGCVGSNVVLNGTSYIATLYLVSHPFPLIDGTTRAFLAAHNIESERVPKSIYLSIWPLSKYDLQKYTIYYFDVYFFN